MSKVAPSDLEAFGRAMREARVLKGWTLEQLGREALAREEAKGFLSKIENGKRQISPLTAGKIARTLDLSSDLLAPFLALAEDEPDEITREDREAETLIRMAAGDTDAPPTAEALMIALAYEFAAGAHLNLFDAYKSLRAALEAAADIKRRGELPQNTGDQLQAVMRRVADLNDQGLRHEAAGELDAAMARVKAEAERLDAEREAIFTAQLDQDRLLNRPEEAARRLIQHLHAIAPAGGVFNATRDLQREWRERGKVQGSMFNLHVALDLAKTNWDRAKGPLRGGALSDLGICHLSIGRMSAEDKHLRVAVKAFLELDKLLSRRKDPMNWATNQNNLGNALSELGRREDSTDRLEEAITAYRAALEERTRERVPLDWAVTQNNLGSALQSLGEREGSADRLEEAIAAYRAALEERTRERVPLKWAATQNNLGIALRWLGQFKKDVAAYDQARAALKLCDEVQTRESVPFHWAETQWNLADLALARHGLSPDPSLLTEARQRLIAAREVFAEGAEHHTGRCDELLAKTDALEADA